jgi:hypothetical protein
MSLGHLAGEITFAGEAKQPKQTSQNKSGQMPLLSLKIIFASELTGANRTLAKHTMYQSDEDRPNGLPSFVVIQAWTDRWTVVQRCHC